MSRNDEHLRFSPRRPSSMEIYRKKEKGKEKNEGEREKRKIGKGNETK